MKENSSELFKGGRTIADNIVLKAKEVRNKNWPYEPANRNPKKKEFKKFIKNAKKDVLFKINFFENKIKRR